MSNDKLAAAFYPQDAPTPQDAPHVGLQGAPVLDRPACQTYPTAKGGAVCGEPATLRVAAIRCPKCNVADVYASNVDDVYLLDVCLPCWQLGGEGVIRHRPCGHTSLRADVWAKVTTP